MDQGKAIEGVGYCGLVCALCSHEVDVCQGCRDGGGDAICIQRKCCLVKGLVGCWECDEFPCDKGFFGDDVWRGLCVGFCDLIRKSGVESCVATAQSAMGDAVDYGDYRHKTAEEIREILRKQQRP